MNLLKKVNTRPSLGHPEASLEASWPSDRYADRARGIAGGNVASHEEWTRLRFTLAGLAALATMLLFKISMARAGDNVQRSDSNNRGRDQDGGKATFSKWLIGNGPNMEGVVGGDVGPGTYTGLILQYNIVSVDGVPVQKIEALYNFHGSRRSFTALVHVEQTGFVTGSKAVITGVVIDGWQKGHAVKGKYTQKSFVHNGVPSAYFEGCLEIDRKAID